MPAEFKLNAKQLERFEKFVKWVKPIYHEGVAPMSPFIWTFRPGCIGEDVVVYYEDFDGASVDLSLDDDGEFLHEFEV